MPVKHAFTSAKSDGGDATLVRPSDWNDDHEGAYSVVNVKTDFGATGDGSTDDTTAIQNAINALNQGANNKGDVLYFPPGEYIVSTKLDFGAMADVRIVGGAAGVTYNETPAFGATLIWNGASGGVLMEFDGGTSINQHGPTIENMGFVHNVGGAGSKCLNLIMTNHVTLRNCSFRGISGTNVEAGVVFDSQINDHAGGDSAWHLVEQCVFRYCSTAINSRHSYGGTIVGGNIIVPASAVGVNFGTLGTPTNVATQNWRVFGLKMDGDTSAKGFTVDGGHNYFYGVVMEDMPTGFEFTNTSGVGQSGFRNVIYGCSATNCTTFVSLASGTEDNVIAGLRGVSVTTFVSDSGTENVWRDIQDQADKLVFGEKYTNQTAPSNPPSGQIHLYSESGIFKAKDSGGTVRQLGDHTHASSGAQMGTIDHGAITGLTDDDHPQYRLESESGTFTVGGVLLDPTAARTIPVWRAPFACTLTDYRVKVVGGTNAVTNAQRDDGTPADVLTGDLTTAPADGWEQGTIAGAEDNFASGDGLQLELVSVSGAVTEVAWELTFTRP